VTGDAVLDLPDEWSVAGARMLDADAAVALGLSPEHHGGLLLEFGDGSRWTLATTALEPFADLLAAEHPDLIRAVLNTAGAIWRLAYGWPDHGFEPNMPGLEH